MARRRKLRSAGIPLSTYLKSQTWVKWSLSSESTSAGSLMPGTRWKTGVLEQVSLPLDDRAKGAFWLSIAPGAG